MCDHQKQTDFKNIATMLSGSDKPLLMILRWSGQIMALLPAELLRDSHLTVEPIDTSSSAKTVMPSKIRKAASVPKRVNGKKVSNMKEPDFKVPRPWGGYHTAA